MQDYSRDSVDHARTMRQHAGESMKNGLNAPGMVVVWTAVIALVIAIYCLAVGARTAAGVGLGATLALGVFGFCWLAYTHRAVRKAERRWRAEHPGEPYEPPTS